MTPTVVAGPRAVNPRPPAVAAVRWHTRLVHRDREGRRRGVRWAVALSAAAAVGLPLAGCSTRSSEDLATLRPPEATSVSPTPSPSTSRVPAPPPVEVDKPPTSARVQEPALRKELLAR